MYVQTYICIHVYVCVYIYIYVYVYIYIYMYIHTHTHTHIYIYIHIYIHIYTYIYIHTYTPKPSVCEPKTAWEGVARADSDVKGQDFGLDGICANLFHQRKRRQCKICFKVKEQAKGRKT